MKSGQPTLVFGDGTSHEIDTHGILASLPGASIIEKVSIYIDTLEPQTDALNRAITTNEGMQLRDGDLEEILHIRDRLMDVVFLQREEADALTKEQIQKKISPLLEKISTLYTSILTHSCYDDLEQLETRLEAISDKTDTKKLHDSEFDSFQTGVSEIQKRAQMIPQNSKTSIEQACNKLLQRCNNLRRFNDDWEGRKARHQID